MLPRENAPAGCAVANSIDQANILDERAPSPDSVHESFRSVLDPPSGREEPAEPAAAPAFFRDLNLDQIVASIIIGKQEYNLAPFFYRPLRTVAAVEYRQAVTRDLQDQARSDAVNEFAVGMRAVREHVAQAGKLYYKYQKQAWSLDGIELYCKAVAQLLSRLRTSRPRSAALASFLAYLETYVASSRFQKLVMDAAGLKVSLSSIRYNLLIGASFVTVSPYRDEANYGAEIQSDFEKFRQGAAADHIFKFGDSPQMNHIESGVLDRVARIFPETFAELESFVERNANFMDPTVYRFDREIQFYVAYLTHMRRLTSAGLPFCYPTASTDSKEERVSGGYDLALANTLLDQKHQIVTNDYYLEDRERIIIVSGPNQGGKTTFARTFGQLHYLAALGCPVCAASARLFLFDKIFTHFEREEDINNLRGKLHDDLHRLHESLSMATPDSIFILNEVFNSTSLEDAVFLSSEVLRRIIALDAICVCVTFMDELASLSTTTIHMASNVKPGDLAQRTFKVTRRPPDGLAYAISVAEKYRLTHAQLQERLNP
jgi:DNA mismatch repair protein MutS